MLLFSISVKSQTLIKLKQLEKGTSGQTIVSKATGTVITNTWMTPTLTATGGTVSGSFPNWSISIPSSGTTYTNGTGISITSGSIIANTAPDQTVTLTGAGASTVTGTYPNFTINSSGTINGSVGATSGLIPFGDGTVNTVTTTPYFKYKESGNNSYATIGSTVTGMPFFVSSREPIATAYYTDYDPNIVSARTIPDNIITNSHGFVEATVFKSTTPNLANNGFTDNGIMRDPTTGSAGSYNHHVAYQSQFKFNNTGTTLNYYFGSDFVTVNSGILTNRHGLYFFDAVGTGSITNQYALYVPTIAKGSSKNEAIHVESNPSFFGGAIRMSTTSGAANITNPAIEWYHATLPPVKTSYITDKIINNTSELKFNVSLYNFTGYKEMLTLRGDDNNTSSDVATINSTKTVVTGNLIVSGNYFYMKASNSPFNYWRGEMVSGVLTWTDTGSTTLP